MVEKIVRGLTLDDLPALDRIYDSRTHLMGGKPFVKEVQLSKTVRQIDSTIGIFVDGILDGYLSWYLFEKDAPRADDSTKFDNPIAYINTNWFYNDPQRELTETGHNLNLQITLLAMYDMHIDRKIYSHWHISPATWSQYTANPVVQDAIDAKWNVYTVPLIANNALAPNDAYGDFVNKNLLPGGNRTGEDIKLRVISLKEEFRATSPPAQKAQVDSQITVSPSDITISTAEAPKKKRRRKKK